MGSHCATVFDNQVVQKKHQPHANTAVPAMLANDQNPQPQTVTQIGHPQLCYQRMLHVHSTTEETREITYSKNLFVLAWSLFPCAETIALQERCVMFWGSQVTG